jgi:hypothetical protein
VDFIQNPSETAFNESGWLAWLPAWRTESFLNNLFAVFANRAYLLRCTNAVPVVWNVTGRPTLRQPGWVPDAFNLRGAPIDPSSPPTFLNFFRHSRAHYNAASGQLQKIYRLNSASGQWQLAAANDPIQSGAAYWIHCEGASDFVAPLEASVDLGDGLDFGTELTELSLSFENGTPNPKSALVRNLSAAGGLLSYYVFHPQSGGQWTALPNPLAKVLTAGEAGRWRLAPRRQDMLDPILESVVEVTDGAGVRLLVPVRAVNPVIAGTGARGEVSAADDANPLAGLWVGSATIGSVSEAHSPNPTTPTPTKSQMNLRLLLHVDANGQTRLLKEVLQMWRDGTYTNDGSGNFVVDRPGQFVLLTDDALIGQFQGAAVRDGEPVGRRLSTIGYDFPASASNNFVNLTGTFAINESINGVLTLPYDHPNNPFKHKYHPDHDNLTVRFDGSAMESYTVTRAVQLQLAASPPNGPAVPDYGYNELGGNYSETITGLHKNPIHIGGNFRLTRVARIAELNPSATP